MNINLKDLTFYYISTNTKMGLKRSFHLENIMKQFNLNVFRIKSVHHLHKNIGGALGHSLALRKGLLQNEFKPFVVLEDDIAFFNSDNNSDSNNNSDKFDISIPQNTDALLLGISYVGLAHDSNDKYSDLYLQNVNNFPNLFRIFNMLSMHAILYVNPKFASVQYIALMEAINRSLLGEFVVWDTVCCHQYHKYNIYALKVPIFYQLRILGGQEDGTKTNLLNYNEKLKDDGLYCSLPTITGMLTKYLLNN